MRVDDSIIVQIKIFCSTTKYTIGTLKTTLRPEMKRLSVRDIPSAEELRQLFDYNPLTGHLTWKIDRGGRMRAGDRAGAGVQGKYRTLGVHRERYMEHQVIWCWMTGEWPIEKIDHKDRKKDNNIWTNLRLATSSQNSVNSEDGPKGHGSLPRGVSKVTFLKLGKNTSFSIAEDGSIKTLVVDDRYIARICVRGRYKHLGTFTDPQLAHEAYKKAHLEAHGEFSVYYQDPKLST